MQDRAVVEEILLIGDYFGSAEDILAREGTKFNEDDRIVELDLSNLGLDELSPTVMELEKLEVLNLKNNSLEYIPFELKELPGLRKLLVEGNPLEALPDLGIDTDVSLKTIEETKRPEKPRLKQKVGYLPDKVCHWCDTAAGYRKEVQRTDSKWGFTTHVSLILVCLNCSSMHQFYSARSILDFE